MFLSVVTTNSFTSKAFPKYLFNVLLQVTIIIFVISYTSVRFLFHTYILYEIVEHLWKCEKDQKVTYPRLILLI